MALAKRSHKSDDVENFDDVTRNLPSLQFESVLSDEEKELLPLRARSHALTAHACAQATYYACVLAEARLIKSQLQGTLEKRRTSHLLGGATARDPLLVGIIGCGRLGSHLAHCLLSFGEVNPEDLKVSTRRPETLTELQEKGVTCTDNSSEVAQSVHILFLCVLPSQFPSLALDIRGHIQKHCIVYSFIPTIPLFKLRNMLDFTNVVHPVYECNSHKHWDYTEDITAVFANPVKLEHTCPLTLHREDSLVITDERFAEQLVYGFMNVCSHMRMGCKDSVDMVNAVMLGHTPKTPLLRKLTLKDFTKQVNENDRVFPKFDLSRLEDKGTPLTEKLLFDEYIRSRFVEKYISVFQQYLEWKTNSLQLTKKQLHFAQD